MNIVQYLVLISSIFYCINAKVTYTNSTTFDEGRYSVQWTHDKPSDTFYFRTEVKATGWISFGFTGLKYSSSWMRDAMHSYDVLVGGVYGDNGTVYCLDYLTAFKNRTQYPDHVDAINDWNITFAEEIGGKTIMEFNRKRVPSEPMSVHDVPRKGDIVITPGKRYFAWAYHKTIDTPYLNSLSLIHDESGLHPVTLIPDEDDNKEPVHITYPMPTRGRAATLHTLPGLAIIGLIIVNFVI